MKRLFKSEPRLCIREISAFHEIPTDILHQVNGSISSSSLAADNDAAASHRDCLHHQLQQRLLLRGAAAVMPADPCMTFHAENHEHMTIISVGERDRFPIIKARVKQTRRLCWGHLIQQPMCILS